MGLKTKILQFVVDALAAFVFYTATLSPYMIFVVGMSGEQYISWIAMQILLVPPLGALFAIIARRIRLKPKEG